MGGKEKTNTSGTSVERRRTGGGDFMQVREGGNEGGTPPFLVDDVDDASGVEWKGKRGTCTEGFVDERGAGFCCGGRRDGTKGVPNRGTGYRAEAHGGRKRKRGERVHARYLRGSAKT